MSMEDFGMKLGDPPKVRKVGVTFYISAIDAGGMVTSQSVFGQLEDATDILDSWVRRHRQGDGWDKPLVMAAIASTQGMIFRYVFDVPGVPKVIEVR